MEKNIPTGVKIIALVDFLIGSFFVILSIAAIGSILQEKTNEMFWEGIISVSIPFLVGVVSILFGLGILKLKDGSRRGNRLYGIVYIIFLLMIHPPHNHNLEILIHCLRIGLFFTFIWMMVYLGLPKVKEQFKKESV